jgi:hypothetical protein
MGADSEGGAGTAESIWELVVGLTSKSRLGSARLELDPAAETEADVDVEAEATGGPSS